ncbi:hypothetical protein ACH4E7_21060 [Kitasatospora sp. NPDC018058]|uniref:hypothetical protein n=1 Tax=Kitasatospora sp. NPDC018058 TaxID=3364025 RepID=UPI0037C007E4
MHAIAYVELYTRDKKPVVDYLVSVLGFARAADSVDVDRSSILLRRRRTQLVVTSGRGIWKYLDEFGDGVADIALTCDDVVSTRWAAVAAGARAVRSTEGSVVSRRMDPVGPIRSAADAPGLSVIPSAPESSRELAPAVAR